MLPSSIHDFDDPKLAAIINATQRAGKMSPEEKVKFLKAAWDAVGSEFGSRHTQYEMFYAGARFVTTGHSYRTFDWDGATGMVDGLMNSYQLADELGRALSGGNESRDRQSRADRLGRLARSVRRRRHDHHRWRAHRLGRHRIGRRGRERRRGDRCRRHDGDPRPDRLATSTSRSATTRRASAPSAIWKATCMAAPRPRSRRREVHVPGRPRDVEGVKALAVAAQRCFADYRPGRHARHRRLGDPRARPARQRTSASWRRRACGWQRPASARSRPPTITCRWWRTRKAAGPDHHLPHRRLVDPGLGRDHRRSSARRCIRTSRSTSMAARPRCRTRTSSA